MTDSRRSEPRCMATCIERHNDHEHRCQLRSGHAEPHRREWIGTVKTGRFSTEKRLFSVSWCGTMAFVGPDRAEVA